MLLRLVLPDEGFNLRNAKADDPVYHLDREQFECSKVIRHPRFPFSLCQHMKQLLARRPGMDHRLVGAGDLHDTVGQVPASPGSVRSANERKYVRVAARYVGITPVVERKNRE
jgi:hypothetical protein